mmetsp:Transcript_52414/g.139219  ORF Transcript_52414/g.139219 Transcript_52414/m.139219 type:complete len:98 (+) Transcript_52414:14-307(+)
MAQAGPPGPRPLPVRAPLVRALCAVGRGSPMQLRYFLNENGKRVYTLESLTGEGDEEAPTFSAHPARFSPDDKYSEQRIKCKKRFKVLKTQEPPPEL